MTVKQLLEYCNSVVIINVKKDHEIIYSGFPRHLKNESILNAEIDEFEPDHDILLIYLKGA